jgi:uncharacterized protein DUF6457
LTAEEWVEAFTRKAGLQQPTPDDMEQILRLASIAAHASERKAAPIVCWVAGRSGRPVAELLRTGEELTNSEG